MTFENIKRDYLDAVECSSYKKIPQCQKNYMALYLHHAMEQFIDATRVEMINQPDETDIRFINYNDGWNGALSAQTAKQKEFLK